MNQNKENKTMKKLYFSMLLMAGLALTACSSDDNSTEPEPQAPKTYYMTVDASKAVNEAFSRMTRALTLTGSTLNASWETTEKVYVQGQLTGGSYFWFENYIQPQSVGTTTRLNGTVSLPDGWAYSSIEAATGAHPTLTLQFPRQELDYVGQNGTLADIAENYDYATATIEVVVDNDRIVPYEEKTVVFKNEQAIVKFTLRDKTDALLNPTALTVRVVETEPSDPTVEVTVDEVTLSSIPEATYTTNGNGVLFVAIPGFSSKKVILTATVGGSTYTFTKSGVTFANGEYYAIGLKMKKSGE